MLDVYRDGKWPDSRHWSTFRAVDWDLESDRNGGRANPQQPKWSLGLHKSRVRRSDPVYTPLRGYVPQKLTYLIDLYHWAVQTGVDETSDNPPPRDSDYLQTAFGTERHCPSGWRRGAIHLSGGEFQRGCMARAICRKPDVGAGWASARCRFTVRMLLPTRTAHTGVRATLLNWFQGIRNELGLWHLVTFPWSTFTGMAATADQVWICLMGPWSGLQGHSNVLPLPEARNTYRSVYRWNNFAFGAAASSGFRCALLCPFYQHHHDHNPSAWCTCAGALATDKWTEALPTRMRIWSSRSWCRISLRPNGWYVNMLRWFFVKRAFWSGLALGWLLMAWTAGRIVLYRVSLRNVSYGPLIGGFDGSSRARHFLLHPWSFPKWFCRSSHWVAQTIYLDSGARNVASWPYGILSVGCPPNTNSLSENTYSEIINRSMLGYILFFKH